MASSGKIDWEKHNAELEARSKKKYQAMLKDYLEEQHLERAKKVTGLLKEGYSFNNLASKPLNQFPTPLSEAPSAPTTNPETMEFLRKSKVPRTIPRTKDQFFNDYKRILKDLIERDTEILNVHANKYNYSTLSETKKEAIKTNLQNMIKYYRAINYDEELLPFDKIPKNQLKIESFNKNPDRFGHLSNNPRNYKSFLQDPIGDFGKPLINPKTDKPVTLKELIEIHFNGNIFEGLSKQSYGLGKKKKKTKSSKKARRPLKKSKKPSKKSLKKSLKKSFKKVKTSRGKKKSKRKHLIKI